ncbi:MAG: hypothetical protein BGO98_32355 [Myxococcales bacterium 68-20]|nr:LamG domain-containing protein [Myxococcales bacterium]OJY18431.1 MAG: hypothetical protein BGO98_32355 [Myxococcales bacterium 68-20]
MRTACRFQTDASRREPSDRPRALRRLASFFLLALPACTPFSAEPPAEVGDAGAIDAGPVVDGAAPPDGGGVQVDAAVSCTLDGAVLALGFDETAGTQLSDSSGASNHGTRVGAMTVPGVHGSALQFGSAGAGSTSVRVPNSTSLDLGGPAFTLAFWIYADAPFPSADEVVLGKPWTSGSMERPYYQFGVEIDTDGSKNIDLFVGTEGGEKRFLGMPMDLEKWVHIAFVLGDSVGWGYLDGVPRAQQSAPPLIVQRGTELILGLDALGQQPFLGKLDEVRIYNRALSAEEVACLARR